MPSPVYNDPRGGFDQLAKRFQEGRDFEIVARRSVSGTLIMAIHGGRIEPGTETIARLVAAEDHGLYIFKGSLPEGNAALHLASTHFDEPRALDLVSAALNVLSIHDCRGGAEFVVAGGRDREGRRRLVAALEAAGVTTRTDSHQQIQGRHPDNICNRCPGEMGIQLEISAALRRRLVDPDGPPGVGLQDFCHLIRKAIQ